jgi:hypothetical protein
MTSHPPYSPHSRLLMMQSGKKLKKWIFMTQNFNVFTSTRKVIWLPRWDGPQFIEIERKLLLSLALGPWRTNWWGASVWCNNAAELFTVEEPFIDLIFVVDIKLFDFSLIYALKFQIKITREREKIWNVNEEKSNQRERDRLLLFAELPVSPRKKKSERETIGQISSDVVSFCVWFVSLHFRLLFLHTLERLSGISS